MCLFNFVTIKLYGWPFIPSFYIGNRQDHLEGIWSGDKTAQEAMDSAKERGDALLRRFEQANK